MVRLRIFPISLLFLALPALAEPVGAPGMPGSRAPTLKEAIGTAYEPYAAASPVWFSVAGGVLSEVHYPSPRQVPIGEIQFVVTDGKGYLSSQKDDCQSTVRYKDDGLVVQISGREKDDLYSFEQEIIADTASPVVRIHIALHWNRPSTNLRVFILFRPNLEMGYTAPEALFATDAKNSIHAALVASPPWSANSVGYTGFSDGREDLSKNFRMTELWHEAGPGNVGLTGELLTTQGPDFGFDLALGFGADRDSALTYATTAIAVPFSAARESYENGWRQYLHELESSRLMTNSQFFVSSTFARQSAQIIKMHEDKRQRGAIAPSLAEPELRARDLYRAAMGLLAAGDTRTPVMALDRLAQFEEEPELAILLAEQLDRRRMITLKSGDREMIRRGASFILSHGERQDPSRIALQIAALKVAGARLKDEALIVAANEWETFLESWTYSSHYGANLDGSFLDLVRYGLRKADDPRILTSLELYESPEAGLAVKAAVGPSANLYRRSPRDEGFSPILGGEKGIYAVARRDLETARAQLYVLEQGATASGEIGDDAACPLVSAHAEDILLHRSIEEGSVFDSPRAVP